MVKCTQNWIYNAEAKIYAKNERNDTKHGETSKSYDANMYAARL